MTEERFIRTEDAVRGYEFETFGDRYEVVDVLNETDFNPVLGRSYTLCVIRLVHTRNPLTPLWSVPAYQSGPFS